MTEHETLHTVNARIEEERRARRHLTEYLGDGAYVRWTGYAFDIFTSNGITETNHVFLEPEHIEVLNRFCKRMLT